LFLDLKTFDSTNLTPKRRQDILRAYAAPRSADVNGGYHRTVVARELEQIFRMRPGTIAIYCAEIKPKLAEVQIAIDDNVEAFEKYERENDERLSGGHLRAQIDRFEKLWRIHFYIDNEASDKLLKEEKLLLLQETVDLVALGEGPPALLRQRAREKALVLSLLDQKAGFNDVEYVEEGMFDFARADVTIKEIPNFPNGAPSIRRFLRRRSDGV
jgi:hypothetical protein